MFLGEFECVSSCVRKLTHGMVNENRCDDDDGMQAEANELNAIRNVPTGDGAVYRGEHSNCCSPFRPFQNSQFPTRASGK